MRRSLLASAVLAASIIGLVVVGAACLPDLNALRGPADAGDESSAVVTGGCGDGVIATLDDGGDAGESCDPGEAKPASCPDCRLVCEGRVDDAGAHCYFALAPSTSYPEAVTKCGASGGHVVTFASDRESSIADDLAGDGGTYWVGLVQSASLGAYGPAEQGEPGLPSSADASCPGCYARGTGLLDPAEDAGAEPACVVAGGGAWLHAACSGSVLRATICEREPPGRRTFFCFPLQCTNVQATAGRKRYLIDVIPRTAGEAKAQCEQYDGGSLAVFESREEREQVLREVAQLPAIVTPFTAWIGIATDDDGGTWKWDDGMPVDGATRPLPWGESQPAGRGAGRAFVRFDVNRYDSQLALTDDGAGTNPTRASICQRGVE